MASTKEVGLIRIVPLISNCYIDLSALGIELGHVKFTTEYAKKRTRYSVHAIVYTSALVNFFNYRSVLS